MGVLSGSYMCAMVFAGSYVDLIYVSPVNPAIALMMILFNSSNPGWATFWIYTMVTFIGSVAAYFFFRFVFIKTIITADEIQAEEDEEDETNKDSLLDD